MRAQTKLRALAFVCYALAACGSERTPTQIVVVIDSDWDGFERLSITLDGFERKQPISADLREQPLPRRLVLVHDGGPLGPIAIHVSGFAAQGSDPVLTESRTNLFFVAGAARLLTINLPYACVDYACANDEACVAGPKCVATDTASKLTPWNGAPRPSSIAHFVDAGAVVGAGLDGGELEPDAARGDSAVQSDSSSPAEDSGRSSAHPDGATPVDAGASSFGYGPANFSVDARDVAGAERVAMNIDCQDATFDSSTLEFSNWCGPTPRAIVIDQLEGGDAALIALSSLQIASGANLRLQGSRPVIFAVFGDAELDGTLDGSAHGTVSGPGAERDCEQGTGAPGANQANTLNAGGGAGGGFGSAGGNGGADVMSAAARGGAIAAQANLSPLRGGCAGGAGGAALGSTSAAHGGGGGGAVQISASGRLRITGVVAVGGGGGQIDSAFGAGGGGGGSGGAILLEAGALDLDANAMLVANGGGGGGGEPRTGVGSTSASPGDDALSSLSAARGGSAGSLAGVGGSGAAVDHDAVAGTMGSLGFGGGGSGGGGGGVGRIRVQRAPSCALDAKQSPLAAVACTSCGTCASAPGLDCHRLAFGSRVLFRCDNPLAPEDARTRCQSAALDVIAIRDTTTNDWIKQQLLEETWIGASDAVQEGSWLWLRDGSLFWSGDATGSPTAGAFSAWASGEPNNVSGATLNADCATIESDGLWRDRLCTDTHPYICE